MSWIETTNLRFVCQPTAAVASLNVALDQSQAKITLNIPDYLASSTLKIMQTPDLSISCRFPRNSSVKFFNLAIIFIGRY